MGGSCSCSARGKNALKSELPNVGMPDVGDPGMPSRRSGVLLPIDSVEPQQPSDGVVAQLLCGGSPTLVADFPAIEPFGNTCEQSDRRLHAFGQQYWRPLPQEWMLTRKWNILENWPSISSLRLVSLYVPPSDWKFPSQFTMPGMV